jgi:hypothetical protein
MFFLGGGLSENTPKFQFKKPDLLLNGIIAKILELTVYSKCSKLISQVLAIKLATIRPIKNISV